ncbi:hypothetical protein BD769DRAFT_1365704, partial [Suillus cothurnatus]
IDHLACDQSSSYGCSHCTPITPNVCCDIHRPSAFPSFDTLISQPPKLPNHSRLPNYTMGPKEYKLCEALEDWREEKMAEKYGCSHLIDISPATIMADSALDCLVNCAHHEKIRTIEDLCKETHWLATDKFGSEVLAITHHIIPAKVIKHVTLTNAPLQRFPLASPVLTVKKSNRCSACQQEGHNNMYCYTFCSVYSGLTCSPECN